MLNVIKDEKKEEAAAANEVFELSVKGDLPDVDIKVEEEKKEEEKKHELVIEEEVLIVEEQVQVSKEIDY